MYSVLVACYCNTRVPTHSTHMLIWNMAILVLQYCNTLHLTYPWILQKTKNRLSPHTTQNHGKLANPGNLFGVAMGWRDWRVHVYATLLQSLTRVHSSTRVHVYVVKDVLTEYNCTLECNTCARTGTRVLVPVHVYSAFDEHNARPKKLSFDPNVTAQY